MLPSEVLSVIISFHMCLRWFVLNKYFYKASLAALDSDQYRTALKILHTTKRICSLDISKIILLHLQHPKTNKENLMSLIFTWEFIRHIACNHPQVNCGKKSQIDIQ